MTSDGTNAFAWDAENRMIKITYPGSNNFSTFVYDGYGRNVSIVETTAGSVTSTKQFVWASFVRKEERDGTGSLTKRFFDLGQMNSATKYFYDLDQLKSVIAMTDNSGNKVAEYAFDPYGRQSKITESVPSDIGYGGYYSHARSDLNLTLTRAYSGSLGRFISRDIAQEAVGTNQFSYSDNSPINSSDPSGLCCTIDFNQLRNAINGGMVGGGLSGAAAGFGAGLVTAGASGGIGAPLIPAEVVTGAIGGADIGGISAGLQNLINQMAAENVIAGPWPGSGTTPTLPTSQTANNDFLNRCVRNCRDKSRGNSLRYFTCVFVECHCFLSGGYPGGG